MSDPASNSYQQKLEETRQLWNSAAAAFDAEPDHGLRDPAVRGAWTRLLQAALPPGKPDVLDIGCGTGSLSVLLAELGCRVTGIDFAPEMIVLAEAKARLAEQPVRFQIMDAAFPEFPQEQFDVIVCRHLLWALPTPEQVLQRWVRLLKPGGRLVLIEGFWHTGAGLRAQEILDALPAGITKVSVLNLSEQPDLWGGAVEDERYLIRAETGQKNNV